MSGRHVKSSTARFRRGRTVAVLTALLVVLALVAPMPDQTEASWADGEVTTAKLTAMTVRAPQSLACSVVNSGLLIKTYDYADLTWTSAQTNTSYEIGYRKPGDQEFTLLESDRTPIIDNGNGTYSATIPKESLTYVLDVLGLLQLLGTAKTEYSVRAVSNSGWRSEWAVPVQSLSVNVIAGALGLNVLGSGACGGVSE